MLKNITALVLTYNSERRLDEVLQSLSFCENILVVDSISTDRTKEIALSHNAEFVEHPFVTNAEQYLYAFTLVKTDWIFIIESDEICSLKLKNSVLSFFNNKEIAENHEFSGAYIARKNFFFYDFLKHSDAYPDYLLRLTNKNDIVVDRSGRHQEFKSKGKTTKIDGDIIHYAYTSFYNYMHKLNEYADASAKEKTEQGKKFSLTSTLLHSIWGFIRIYIYKRGFLDGKAGFIMACHHAFYVFLKYVRIGENEKTFGLNHKYLEK